jgi:hypothetical protein
VTNGALAEEELAVLAEHSTVGPCETERTEKVGNRSPRDPLQGRRSRAEQKLEGKMGETLSSQPVSTRLQRIAEQAQARPEMVFTTLAHLMDEELLREAYERTRKDSSPGVDGVTAEQ